MQINQVDSLETLKSIKRKARATYNCFRTIYSNKLSSASNEERKILREAISALDAMYAIYEKLKINMRKESLAEQINFAKKWNTYTSCIEAVTAYQIKDKYLLDGIKLEESSAKETALGIWLDYNKQLRQKQHEQYA